MSYQDEREYKPNTAAANIANDAEYREFMSWREQRIREEVRGEAQAEAAQVNLAAENAANEAALAVMRSRGINDVSEMFGNSATYHGQNVAKVLFAGQQGVGQPRHYSQLRKIAIARGLTR